MQRKIQKLARLECPMSMLGRKKCVPSIGIVEND